MKKLTITFLLVAVSILNLNAQVITEKIPSWVTVNEFPKDFDDKENVSQGTALLLYDQQINTVSKTVFYRFTTEIIDNVGIQNASTISVDYDPTYQKLKFHTINIIRNGEVIDKLKPEHFQVMRRELNAENHLYDGSLSAVMNVSDVRMGDIIDYSYSVVGSNPIHKDKFSSSFYLNDYDPIGLLNVDILTNEKIYYKLFNNAKEPIISHSKGLTKYSWNIPSPVRVEFEDNTPAWKMIYDMVAISNYDSWKEVINWGIDVFNIKENLSKELKEKIDEINTTFDNEGDKIKASLDFVQDEIRYLGLEYGIGAYKPFAPNKVLEQRFGDCKDKSLLMTTMLNQMGIEAYPMLVNTSLKHSIKEFVPSPKFFDHCVVKVIDKSNKEHWYDPTITNQGGSYFRTSFPNYEYGLVLKEGNSEFDHIKASENNKTETVEEFTLDEIGGGANLKVTTVYFEGDADDMRSYFKMNGPKKIRKDFENYYANYYNKVSALQDPKVEDNIEENELRVYEEYQIDSLWEPMTNKEGFISASFIPSTISGVLYSPSKQERKHEFAISYPVNKYHDIKINLPTKWNITSDYSVVSSSGFYYDWKVDYNRKSDQIEISHILKTQKNHVTSNELAQYTKDVNKIDDSFGYVLYISDDSTGVPSTFGEDDATVQIIEAFFNVGIWVFLACGLFVFIYLRNEKKNKPKNL